jgi:hypothetical protein
MLNAKPSCWVLSQLVLPLLSRSWNRQDSSNTLLKELREGDGEFDLGGLQMGL